MGQSPQTIANGLKPYGLVYALIQAGIPVDWAIESSKAKDGVDFTANGTNYSGGSFIIAFENRTAAVDALITTWRGLGVKVDGPLPVSFSAPVYRTLTIWPRAFLDDRNDGLITPYYTNAGIPPGTYIKNTNPTMLPQCGSVNGTQDVYILPHADPQDWVDGTWITALQNFINNGGAMWAGCHAVSAMESIPGCNFLSNNGLVLWGDHSNGITPPPYTYTSSGHPLMQFMGILDGATTNGSEQIYVPGASGWRNTTTLAVFDPDYTNTVPNPDVAYIYPNAAAVLAYGPAFGTKGLIMYEAGHSLNGTDPEAVAAQRAFFNFILLAGGQPQTNITPPDVSNQTSTTCSGITFSVIPSGVPEIVTYTWLAPTGTGFTGGSAQPIAQTSINQTLTNITSSPVTAVYTVTPQIGGCVGNPFTLTVTVNPAPLIAVTPSAPSICSGSSTSLTASGAVSYTWSPATGLSPATGATVTASPTTTTTYTVTGTDAIGCINTKTVTVTVNTSSVTAGASPNPLCVGSNLNLSSSNTFTSSVLLSENFNDPSNSWTKINNSTGGTPANATWNLQPNGYLIGCSGDNSVLHSNDDTQFYLSNSCAQGSGGTTNTILQSPLKSTVGYSTLTLEFYHYFKYFNTATAKVEVSTDGSNWTTLATYTSTQGNKDNFKHVTISLNAYIGRPVFYVRFKYDAPWSWYWAIDNVTITGTASSPISWSGPNGFTSAQQNPSISSVTTDNTGLYTVTYTDPVSTCQSSNSVMVTVNPLPTITVTPASPAICFGSSTSLTANGAATYSWSPGTGLSAITGPTVTANPVTTTTYTVTGTDANGCSNSATVTVTVNTLPTITVTPASATICNGSSTSLTASGAITYNWSPGTGLSSTTVATVIANPTTTTTFTVTGTDANGCSSTATVTITVNPTPVTTGLSICTGGTGSLSSSSTCPAGSAITVGPTNAGTGNNVTGVGTVAWTNPGNAITNNGTYATVTLSGAGTKTSNYLRTTNYNFSSIPANATISGITVTIGRLENTGPGGSTNIRDVGVNLLKAGTITGINKANTTTDWPTTLTASIYGGTSDLWGTTWTVSDIVSSNFGVSLYISSANDRTASVDYIQISVTYTLPGILNWYTVSSGGSSIGTGSPFNPVGAAGSGLPNTNTPGTTAFYAECSSVPGCRTATNFVINPTSAITSMTANVCNAVGFSVTPVNGTNGTIPSGTTYSWAAPVVTGGITGGAASSGFPTSITGTLTNPTNTSQTATYTVTPTSGSCVGSTFTVIVTVYGNLTANISGGTSPICYNTAPGIFTATGSGGTGSYTYLWYKDGISTGITTQTYAPGSLTATSAFYCAVTSGSCGTVNTSTTIITVNALPTITGTLSVCAGSTTQLTGSGSPAVLSPWVSATTSAATVNSTGIVTGLSAGTSVITYTNINGCSITTTITVQSLPVIITQPIDRLDCEGHIVSFNVVATGSGLTYTWQRKKPLGTFADIPVELNVSYPTPGTIRLENVGNSDAPDGTQYRVVITNSDNCTIISNPATLSVNEITGITPTSTSVTLCQGDNYSYTVTTSYPSNVVSYQWKKWNNPGQWDPVINGGAISGATTDHLIFTGVTPSESGKYKVTVVFHSSGADCNVTSDTRDRELIVNPLATVTPGGPDIICQSATPTPIALNGASVGGGATTGVWSITSLTPANGGVNGLLSNSSPTSSPATVIYTTPANYVGTITLTLTTDDPIGPCGGVSATRTVTINQLPTTSPIYHH